MLGRGEGGQRFALVDARTLRQLDRHGQPILSRANLDLRRLAKVDPVTESMRWRGEFVYMADAANFTDCASGLHWPVAMIGDYLSSERRYSQLRTKPGAALLVSFDGHLEVVAAMEGPPREHMVIDRLESAHPGGTCATPLQPTTAAAASLTDTYWKLTEFDNKVMTIAPGQQREVRLTLASGGNRAFGFSGCNQFSGSYELEGASLRFSQLAGTWLWRLQGTTWVEELKLSTAINTKADVKTIGDEAHILLYAGTTTQLVSAESTIAPSFSPSG